MSKARSNGDLVASDLITTDISNDYIGIGSGGGAGGSGIITFYFF